MAGSENIGRMELELGVKGAAAHDAALKQSEQAAEQYAETAGKASDDATAASEKMLDGMKSAAHEVHGVAKAFEKFVAIPGMILGVAAAFYEMGRAIREGVSKAFETAEEKLDKFYQSIDKGAPEERLGKLNDKIQELTKQLDGGAVNSVYNYLFGAGGPDAIEAQLKSLTQMQEDLQRQVIAKKNKEETDAVEAVKRRTQELSAEGMTDQEKAALATELKVAELRDRLAKEKNGPKALTDALQEQIEAEYRARDEKIRQLDEDRDQRQYETNQKDLEDKETKALELHQQRLKMQSDLLDGEKKLRFDLENQIDDLKRRLATEYNEDNRRELEAMMKLAAEKFGKELQAQFQTVYDKWQQLQRDSQSSLTLSLNQLLQEVRNIGGRL